MIRPVSLPFALSLALAAPVSATTLEQAMDACAMVMETASTDPVAAFGLAPFEETALVAPVDVDGRRIWIKVGFRPDKTIQSCALRGDQPGNPDSIRNPGQMWSMAEPQIAAWFAARVAQPGSADISGPFARQNYAVACPAPSREGFFLEAQPGEFGSLSGDIPAPDRPFMFIASRSANQPTQACDFYTQLKPGG